MSPFEFSPRPVGIELEIPECCYELEGVMGDYHWEGKEDGSIPEDGREFVSPPISGKDILTQVKAFYDTCEAHEIKPEHNTCGTHVHINALDIYAFINKQKDPEELSRRVEEWGMVVAALSRLFVGPGRNGTRFARGGFAIRDSYNCDPGAMKKSRRVDYPTLAIREHTFEFRIFPSTTNASYTLARIAFCQAAGDWLFRNLKVQNTTFKRRLAILSKPLEGMDVFSEKDSLVAALQELNAFDKAQEVLLRIYENFRQGNKSVLPAIWLQERDKVRQDMKHRIAALQTLGAVIQTHSTPNPLRDWLLSEYGPAIQIA